MPEVLELNEVRNVTVETVNDAFSWKVEMPDSVKKENNLSQHSYLVLTVYDGKISGELINVTDDIKSEVNRITDKYRKSFEEMKRLGD